MSPPAVYNPVENRRINVGKNYARPDRSGWRIYPPLSPVAPTAFPRPVHRPERPFSIHAPPFHMVFTSTAARRLYALRSAPCAVPQAVDKSKDIGGPDGDNETDKFSVRKVSTVSTAYHQYHKFLLFSLPNKNKIFMIIYRTGKECGKTSRTADTAPARRTVSRFLPGREPEKGRDRPRPRHTADYSRNNQDRP